MSGCHEPNYDPDVDPSNLIDDEAEFKALTGIDWTSPDFQTMGEEEEPAQEEDEEAAEGGRHRKQGG